LFAPQSTNLSSEVRRGKTSQIGPIKLLVDHLFICQEVPGLLLCTRRFPFFDFYPEGFELKCSKCQFENPEGTKFCNEGAIKQFTGEGVMALFGAPVAHEGHARRSCHLELAIQKATIGYG
jgi:hypothetical protein